MKTKTQKYANKIMYNGSEIDTAYGKTRQLDYYANLGVTTRNYSGAIKKNSDGKSENWWLRGAYSGNIYDFLGVNSVGYLIDHSAYNNYGLAPAFRIG